MTFQDNGGEYLAGRRDDPEAAARVAEILEQMRQVDTEEVYARARLIWGGDSARVWMESPNAFLSGARPLDVLATEGAARVVEALDAEMGGGAA